MKFNSIKSRVIILILPLFFMSSYKPLDKKANNRIQVDPITAMKTIEYGAAIASFVSGISKSKKMDRIESMLVEALTHLRQIRSDVATIKEQNKEILRKLDNLPIVIRAIIREELNDNELKKAYNNLDNLIDNYPVSREFRRSLRTGENGYKIASSSLRFAFHHENRVSDIPKLIYYSEFLLMIAEYNNSDIIVNYLENKYILLEQLMEGYNMEIDNLAKDFIKELRNQKFIQSHNLNSFTTINSLEYSFLPFRDEVKQCWYYEKGEYFERKECFARDFNIGLRAFKKKLENKRIDLENKLKIKEELKVVMKALQDYTNSIKSNS